MKNHNPEKIISRIVSKTEPSMRYRGGMPFEVWQKTARTKLRELLGLDYMEKCNPELEIEYETEHDEYTEMRFSFQSEPGYYVPGYVLIPKNVTAPFPVMICVQGHTKGMHISIGVEKFEGDYDAIHSGDRNFAQIAVRRGYCAVVIEQRYMGECGGDSKGAGCSANRRAGTASAMKSLLVGRCAVGERVWDISRTIDVIYSSFKQININEIACMGNSGGGTSVFYASCIDERIKYSMPSCAVCTYLDSIVNLSHCPCNYIPSIARYFDMGDLGGLIAPRKLVVVAGKEDNIFPIEGVYKTMDIIKNMYSAAGAEDNVVLAVGGEGHRFYADIAYSALHRLKKVREE